MKKIEGGNKGMENKMAISDLKFKFKIYIYKLKSKKLVKKKC